MKDAYLDPWTEAIDEFPVTGTPEQKFQASLRHAILAPSSHNSQPWLFRLRGDTLELLADRSRALPVVDPEDRELIISCGVVLKYIRIALANFGQVIAVETPADGKEPDLLARIRITGEAEPKERDRELFRSFRTRRTNRRPFDAQPVPEPLLGRARTLAERERAWVQTLTGEDDRAALAGLIADGDRAQLADRRFRRELAAWVHSNRSSSHDGMPGYAHGVGDLASHVGPLVIRTFDIGDGRAARDRELAMGSPALAVLWSEEDLPREWLHAGQALAAFLLSLDADGIAVSYLNQPIEIPELRDKVRELLGRDGFPQLILRLGYGRECRPTPRRALDDMLLLD
jgi:nitroreductase